MLAGVDCTSASPHLIHGVQVGDAPFRHGKYIADLGRYAKTMPVSPAYDGSKMVVRYLERKTLKSSAFLKDVIRIRPSIRN